MCALIRLGSHQNLFFVMSAVIEPTAIRLCPLWPLLNQTNWGGDQQLLMAAVLCPTASGSRITGRPLNDTMSITITLLSPCKQPWLFASQHRIWWGFSLILTRIEVFINIKCNCLSLFSAWFASFRPDTTGSLCKSCVSTGVLIHRLAALELSGTFALNTSSVYRVGAKGKSLFPTSSHFSVCPCSVLQPHLCPATVSRRVSALCVLSFTCSPLATPPLAGCKELFTVSGSCAVGCSKREQCFYWFVSAWLASVFFPIFWHFNCKLFTHFSRDLTHRHLSFRTQERRDSLYGCNKWESNTYTEHVWLFPADCQSQVLVQCHYSWWKLTALSHCDIFIPI